MAMKNDTKFLRGIHLSFQNWHEEFKRILAQAFKNLKNLHFNGLHFTKNIMYELKKYREVMFDGTENLSFQKWHEEFGKFLQAEK